MQFASFRSGIIVKHKRRLNSPRLMDKSFFKLCPAKFNCADENKFKKLILLTIY